MVSCELTDTFAVQAYHQQCEHAKRMEVRTTAHGDINEQLIAWFNTFPKKSDPYPPIRYGFTSLLIHLIAKRFTLKQLSILA